MVVWGFIQKFLMTESSFFAQAAGLLIAAVLLWDLLFRSQISFSLSFFEEVYARNLGHLLATPMRAWEYVTVLPDWAQGLSAILPASYIFEGMRAVILDGEVRVDLLLRAGALNIIWIGLCMAAFLAFFRTARERGTLLQLGE